MVTIVSTADRAVSLSWLVMLFCAWCSSFRVCTLGRCGRWWFAVRVVVGADGSEVATGERGQGGIEDEEAVAGHEQHAREQHLLGDGLGRVLQGGGLLQPERVGLGLQGVSDAGPVTGLGHGPGQIGEVGDVEAEGQSLEALPGLLR